MNIRKILLATVTVAALAPAVSNASPEKTSLKACANAFAASLAAPGASSPGYKLAYRGSFDSGLLSFYATDYTFTLEAHDPKSGVAIARARCSTDVHGTVTTMASLPLNAKTETLAAVF